MPLARTVTSDNPKPAPALALIVSREENEPLPEEGLKDTCTPAGTDWADNVTDDNRVELALTKTPIELLEPRTRARLCWLRDKLKPAMQGGPSLVDTSWLACREKGLKLAVRSEHRNERLTDS